MCCLFVLGSLLRVLCFVFRVLVSSVLVMCCLFIVLRSLYVCSVVLGWRCRSLAVAVMLSWKRTLDNDVQTDHTLQSMMRK